MPMKNACLFTVLLSSTTTAASIAEADSMESPYRLDLPGAWPGIAAALDDLRRLGTLDLHLNFGK